MRRGLIWAGIIALILAVAGLFGWRFAVHWAPARIQYAVQGIDVSDENGAIDWAMVKARDVDFAYVRATSGTSSRDPGFTANWAGAGDAQIRRGALHVFSLCGTAEGQAGAFGATVPSSTALTASVTGMSTPRPRASFATSRALYTPSATWPRCPPWA